MSTEIYKRTMRVCPICNHAYWHPLQYCLKCPGKLVERVVEGPITVNPGTWGEVKDYDTWLKNAGLKDGGV